MDELKNTILWKWRYLFLSFVIIFILVVVVGMINTILATGKILTKATETINLMHDYSWFQEMYNEIVTTKSIVNNSLDSLAEKSISQEFKEKQMTNLYGLNNYLQDLISQYNLKSRTIARNDWKNKNLPYQIEYGGSLKDKLNLDYAK